MLSQWLKGMSPALPHGGGHGGSDLPQHGVGDDNAQGTHDDVRRTAGHYYGVFPSGGPVRACLEHSGGGGGIGAHGSDCRVRQGLPDGRHQLPAHATSLGVDDENLNGIFHNRSPFSVLTAST